MDIKKYFEEINKKLDTLSKEDFNELLRESDEPRFSLEEDSICYGCEYYTGEALDEDDVEMNGCIVNQPCFEGNMNGYRMEG